MNIQELGIIGGILLAGNHAIQFGREMLKAKMDGSASPRGSQRGQVPYDEQASRVIYDVSRTLSEVATNQERQQETAGRILTSLEKVSEILGKHVTQADEYMRHHG